MAPQSFVMALREITASTIHPANQPPGGAVSALVRSKAGLREHLPTSSPTSTGLVASAATFVAMAADQVVMNKGALFMIHKGLDIRLRKPDELVVNGRSARQDRRCPGADVRRPHQAGSETIEEWMAAETWFTADEAVAKWFRRQHC